MKILLMARYFILSLFMLSGIIQIHAFSTKDNRLYYESNLDSLKSRIDNHSYKYVIPFGEIADDQALSPVWPTDIAALSVQNPTMNNPDAISRDDIVWFLIASRLMSEADSLSRDSELRFREDVVSPLYSYDELRKIRSWWNANSQLITSDFLCDIVYDYLSFLKEYEVKSDIDSGYREMLFRINHRLQMRRNTSGLHRVLIRYVFHTPRSEDFTFSSFIDKLQAIFDSAHNGNVITQIELSNEFLLFAYISRRLIDDSISLQQATSSTLTRREFEDIKDWWFANNGDVYKKHLENLLVDWGKSGYPFVTVN